MRCQDASRDPKVSGYVMLWRQSILLNSSESRDAGNSYLTQPLTAANRSMDTPHAGGRGSQRLKTEDEKSKKAVRGSGERRVERVAIETCSVATGRPIQPTHAWDNPRILWSKRTHLKGKQRGRKQRSAAESDLAGSDLLLPKGDD